MITTIEIIKRLVGSNVEVVEVSLVQFPNTSLLQERLGLANGKTVEAINQALSFRLISDLPFWDSLLATQFRESFFVPEILKEALVHNKVAKVLKINRNELHRLDEFSVKADFNFGINSRIQCAGGEQKHFMLFDFHIPNHFNNLKCVEEVIRLLGITGYLMKTNKSYHFIGDTIITEENLTDILHHALLLSPIMDKNWITHQLIEKSCTIRITAKDGQIPFLIKHIK